MSMDHAPTPPAVSLWTSLIQYYRSCLAREQEFNLRVPADPSQSVILREIEEHLITRKAITTILAQPHHTQPVLGYLTRRGRGIAGTFIYGYPLARQGDELVPLCYTEVRLEPGSAPQTVVLTRGNAEIMINRQFLMQSAGLTHSEIDSLLRALRSQSTKDLAPIFDQYLLEVDLVYDGVLFASDVTPGVRGPARELQLMEQLRKERLPESIRYFIGEQGIPAAKPAAETVTILPADAAQQEALRRRHSPFQVVAGPSGSGKTQTAINLIANAALAGQRVLYINRDESAAEAVFQALTGEDGFRSVLRIGGREVRAASLRYAHQVIQSVRQSPEQHPEQDDLPRESRRLGEETARLEAEAQELLHLDEALAELAVQIRLLEESLQQHPHRAWITAQAERITPELAAQFQPEQLVPIRQLLARAITWEQEPASLSGRLREMMRAGQIKNGLKQAGVPEFLHPEGDLPAQVASLIRLEQGFPFLLAKARQHHARSRRSQCRPLNAIQAALKEAHEAKVAADRQRLHHAWFKAAERLRPRCDELEAIIRQEEQALTAPPAQRGGGGRRGRFPELLEAFPVVISQTFAVAGTIPNEPELFDLLIIDNGSGVDIPSFLPVLYRAKRVCIIGDLQGPKHRSNLGDEEDSRLLGMVHNWNLAPFAYTEVSVLDRALQVVGSDRLLRLTRQYRTAPSLFGWCNEQFQESQVRAVRPEQAGAAGFQLEDAAEGVTICPTPAALSQAQNPQEAKRVIRLITQSIARGETDLAILTPFRGQALLLQTLLHRLSEVEPDPARAQALRQVAVMTPNFPSFHRHQVALLSLVVARGATTQMLTWLEQHRQQLGHLIATATDRLTVVGHRATLESGGPTLASLVAHGDRLRVGDDRPITLRPGLQPERLGLLQSERPLLREWLTLPGALAEALSEPEQEVHTRLTSSLRGRPVLLAPRLSLAWLLELALLATLPPAERERAAGVAPLLALLHSQTLRPIAVVALEEDGPELLDSLCQRAGLPLFRVRPGAWEALQGIVAQTPQG